MAAYSFRGVKRRKIAKRLNLKSAQSNENTHLNCGFFKSGPYKFLNGSLKAYSGDLSRLHRILDPLLITLLFIILQPSGHIWTTPFVSIPFWCIVGSVATIVLSRLSLYRSYRFRSLKLLAKKITTSWFLVLGLLLLVAYVDKSTASFSRIATSCWALAGWIWLIGTHVFGRRLLRQHRCHGGNSQTIVYWGMPQAASAFAEQIEKNPWMGFRIVKWFSPVTPEPTDLSPYLPSFGGGIDELRNWLSSSKVDRLMFSDTSINTDEMCSIFGDTSIPVAYAPHWSQPSMRFTVETIGPQPCIELWGREKSIIDQYLKRVFDLTLGTISAVLISPVLIIVALAVRVSSPGPILYKQERYGLDGKPFKCFKFRSMSVQDSDKQEDLKQATKDDPRVTKVGSILRKWSLDELPQLLNVIRGDMSLVGPRPHATQHNEQYRKVISGYMQRHASKPGITGLAQVNGLRGETRTLLEMEERIKADLRYQRDWNLTMDIKIIIKTILCIRAGNAY